MVGDEGEELGETEVCHFGAEGGRSVVGAAEANGVEVVQGVGVQRGDFTRERSVEEGGLEEVLGVGAA